MGVGVVVVVVVEEEGVPHSMMAYRLEHTLPDIQEHKELHHASPGFLCLENKYVSKNKTNAGFQSVNCYRFFNNKVIFYLRNNIITLFILTIKPLS